MGWHRERHLGASLPVHLLWKISSPNLVEVERATNELLEGRWSAVRQDGDEADKQAFLTALRILGRESLVVIDSPRSSKGSSV